MESYSIELKPASGMRIYLWPILLFYLFLYYVLFNSYSKSKDIEDKYCFIFIILFLSFFFLNAIIKMLWTFIGCFHIEASDTGLITTRKFMGNIQIKKYKLGVMKELKVRTDMQTPTFIGLPSRRSGSDIGIHYKDPVILSFVYISSYETIGHYCESFDADTLLKEIQKRKQLVKDSPF